MDESTGPAYTAAFCATMAEIISDQLDAILDAAETLWGYRPIFDHWDTFGGESCRAYTVGGEIYKLVAQENEDAGIVGYAWIIERECEG